VVYIWGGGCCRLTVTEFCHVKNSLCVQVLRSPILAALLRGTRAVGVSQSLRHGTRNGITELSLLVIFNRGRHLYSEGGHHVGHRPMFSLISICHPLLVVSCNDRMGAGDATTLTQALLASYTVQCLSHSQAFIPIPMHFIPIPFPCHG